MGRRSLLLCALMAGALLLASCGGSTQKLPGSRFEKVKFAFDGVESSFKSKNDSKKLMPDISRKEAANPGGALNTLYGLFTSQDDRGDVIDELEYNQPPMVQFQCLKKVIEKVGDSYSFGTKYNDVITGTAYIDMETGHQAEGEANRYDFTFDLAIAIDIDSNDLITADVSFDITLRQGSVEYATKWYVGMELDYDMSNTTPNYTMSMFTENDELNIPYRNHYTYEYDYVKVANNKINEWRKFCLACDRRLVKDSGHSSFDAYLNDGIDFTVECFAWYKNSSFKKNNNISGDKKNTFGRELFLGLGLNGTDIGLDAFFARNATKNSVITTCYNEFSQLIGEPLIYDLVARSEDGGHGGQSSASGIRAMSVDLSCGMEYFNVPDVTIGELLSGYSIKGQIFRHLRLFYCDNESTPLDEITDFSTLDFEFKANNFDQVVQIGIDEKISDGYRKISAYGIDILNLSTTCILFVKDKANPSIAGSIPFYYSGELDDGYVKPTFPAALTALGVPEYEGERIEFNYHTEGERLILDISSTNDDEADAFMAKLGRNGFDRCFDFEWSANDIVFKKDLGNYLVIYLVFGHAKMNESARITAWQADITPSFPDVLLGMGIPLFEGASPDFGDFTDWGGRYDFNIRNVTSDEVDAYKQSLIEAGFSDEYRGEKMFGEEGTYYWKAGEWYDIIVHLEFAGDTLAMHVFEGSADPVEEEEEDDPIFSVAMTGDFNNWSVTDGLLEFSNSDNHIYGLKHQYFAAGSKFKIIVNHAWGERGGYGYDDIIDISNYSLLISPMDDERNIYINNNLYLDFNVIYTSLDDVSITISNVEAA